MRALLQINSSLAGASAGSNRRPDRPVAGRAVRSPGLAGLGHDREPRPQRDATRLAALARPAAGRRPSESAIAAEANRLITEVEAAEHVVIAAPLDNLSARSTLESRLDDLARAGVPFRCTASGPGALLTDRRATRVTTRGGVHRERAEARPVRYVRGMLARVGIADTEVVYAEGAALRHARLEIDSLAARRVA
jgi:FMN-dependent NADH-azoreductase